MYRAIVFNEMDSVIILDEKTWDVSHHTFGLVQRDDIEPLRTIPWTYNQHDFYLKTPMMECSQGITSLRFGRDYPTEYRLRLSLGTTPSFVSQMSQLDQLVLREASKPINQNNWLGYVKGNYTDDVILHKYCPSVKYPHNKITGEKDQTQPSLSIKIPSFCEVYDFQDHIINLTLDQLPRLSQCSVVMKGSMWANQQGLGISWTAIQIKIFPSLNSLPKSICLLDDTPYLPDTIQKRSHQRSPEISISLMGDVFYGGSFRYEIAPYLTPKELYDLRSVSKSFRLSIQYDLIRESVLHAINHRLHQIFGSQTTTFKYLMDVSHAFISGSFILQCFLGEFWAGSDIDIYLPAGNDQVLGSFLHDTLRSSSRPIKSYRFDRQYQNHIVEHSWSNGIRLQVITLEDPIFSTDPVTYMKNFLQNDFDFDVCANLYYITNRQETVYCHSLNGIMNKTITCQGIPTQQRVSKYKRRGFVFKDLTFRYHWTETQPMPTFSISPICPISPLDQIAEEEVELEENARSAHNLLFMSQAH